MSEGCGYCPLHHGIAYPRTANNRRALRTAQIKAALSRLKLKGANMQAELIDQPAELPPYLAALPNDATVDVEDIMGAGNGHLRPVAAIFADAAHGGCGELQPIPTALPILEWVDPTDLLIDETYQRGLGPKSVALIRHIAEHWDWRRFKVPNVAWTPAGLELTDGQHTAIAAACRPDVPKIPVLITEAKEKTDRAAAFVGLNRDRLNVSAMQLHHAMVTAGDDDAVTVEQVCARAGVTLIRSAWGGHAWKVGETVAVDAIRKLVDVRGAMTARKVLETLVQAGCAPVAANQIKAADMLLTTAQYAEQLEHYPQNVADLATAIRHLGAGAEREAKLFAKANCVPMWKALAATWFAKTRKRRKAA